MWIFLPILVMTSWTDVRKSKIPVIRLNYFDNSMTISSPLSLTRLKMNLSTARAVTVTQIMAGTSHQSPLMISSNAKNNRIKLYHLKT